MLTFCYQPILLVNENMNSELKASLNIYGETLRYQSRNILKEIHFQFSYICIGVFYMYVILQCLLFLGH